MATPPWPGRSDWRPVYLPVVTVNRPPRSFWAVGRPHRATHRDPTGTDSRPNVVEYLGHAELEFNNLSGPVVSAICAPHHRKGILDAYSRLVVGQSIPDQRLIDGL